MFHCNFLKKATSSSLLAFMALGCWTAKTEKSLASGQTDVSVELMLSIDVSGSVNATEYDLQMDGYAAAFRDSEVISTIESLPKGLAVGVQFWSSRPAPEQPWRKITTAEQSRAFADYLDTLARPGRGTTSIYKWNNQNRSIGSGTNVTGAITAATTSITTNSYNGNILVIDVSGDGNSNGTQYNGNSSHDGSCGVTSCTGVQNARDAAVNLGITINGLPIEANSSSTTITNYYNTNVKGGTRGFVETASSFNDFTRAAKTKIYQEISAVFAPIAQPDIITTDEDTPVTYNVIIGDSANNNAGQDTDPDNDPLKIKQFKVGNTVYEFTTGTNIIDVTLASGATMSVKRNGKVTYDPNGQFESLEPGDTGKDEFVYTIKDTSGYTSTAQATFDVNGVADNPVAVDDTFSMDEDTTRRIHVLRNDSDPNTEKRNLKVTEINGVALGLNETYTLNSGATLTVRRVGASYRDRNGQFTLEYDPTVSNTLNLLNDGESALETFTYTVSDPEGNTDQGSASVTVIGVTDTYAD
ncbi:MAG: DUF1194 domain-containing protein [Cyanobacteria bacterium P01_G01_bin.67]